jgi:hypothetical protein
MYWYVVISLITIASVGTSVFIYSFLRHHIERSKIKEDREIISYALNTLSLFYCILIGLVVVDVQSQHNEIQENIVKEAGILLDIHHISKSFSFFDQDAVKKAIGNYVDRFFSDELPVLKKRKESGFTSFIHADPLWSAISQITPRDMKEAAVYQNMLDRLDSLTVARFARFSSADGRTTTFLWVVLLYGGALVLGCSLLFSSKSTLAHLIHLSFNVSLIALILLLIYWLDSPFVGPTQVTYHALHEVLEETQGST